jgi:hypothetical protein
VPQKKTKSKSRKLGVEQGMGFKLADGMFSMPEKPEGMVKVSEFDIQDAWQYPNVGILQYVELQKEQSEKQITIGHLWWKEIAVEKSIKVNCNYAWALKFFSDSTVKAGLFVGPFEDGQAALIFAATLFAENCSPQKVS